MEITVLQHEPTVDCGGSVAVQDGFFEACLSIMNDIDVDDHYTTFGAGAGAAVRLPYTQGSREWTICARRSFC